MKALQSALVILSLVFSTTIISCGGSSSTPSDKKNVDVSETIKNIHNEDAKEILPDWPKDNSIVNHVINDADNLHPTNGKSATRSWILQYTQNFLLRSDPINLGICPDIAVAMPEVSDDKLRYTYTLRTDATWDDGSPVSVDDIIFTFKVTLSPLTNNPHFKPYIENLKTIEIDANNAQRFTIVMAKEYIQNINFVSDCPIMQRKFFDPQNIFSKYTFDQLHATDFDKTAGVDITNWSNTFNDGKYGNDINLMTGLGAYKITSWTRGQSLILERKQNHWTSKLQNPTAYETAYPDKIIFKMNTDENSQKLEFKAQAMDVSAWMQTATVLDLLTDANFLKNYNVQFTDNYNYNYIGMNLKPDGTTHKKIFTDEKVRKAMAYLTPVDDMIQIIAHGYAKRQVSITSPLKVAEYNRDLTLIPLDIEKAKTLLDDAGWKDTDGDNVRDKIVDGEKIPLSFDLMYMTGQKSVEDIVKMIAESFYKAGVKANLKPFEFNAFYEHAQKHDFDMYMGAWAGSSLPEDYSQLFSTQSWLSGGSNFVGFGNAESDQLLDSIKYSIDDTKRIALSKRLQKLLYDNQPYIFLYSSSKKNVMHKRFGNQYMTFDRPNIVLNNMRLLSLYGLNNGASVKETTP